MLHLNVQQAEALHQQDQPVILASHRRLESQNASVTFKRVVYVGRAVFEWCVSEMEARGQTTTCTY